MIDRIRMLFRSSSKAKLVVLFVLFSIVLVECAVNSYYKARIEKRLHHTVESHTGFYNATVESYKTTSEVIAKQILANPKLTKILIDSIDKSKIKSSHDELLSSFKTVYKDNQSISLNILQFQNANGDVVARFQKPTEYGDNVIPFRYLLRECQEKHKSVFGFERGRFFNAYRYVYPVFANNKFVGSVELGIAESQINNSIRKNFGVGVYLALSNTITDKKSVQFQQKSFFTSENLYHNGSIYSQAELDLIGRLLKDFEFTQGNVTKDGYYYHYGLNSDTAYTVVVKPFLDFYGKKIGYIVFYEKNNDLKSLQKELYFALIITMIMLVFAYISLIGLYHWYNKEKLQQQVAISKENKSLVEAMIEAEPECVKIIDEYGNLIYMNQAGLDMIDASADEIFGKSVLNIVNPEYRDEFSDMCKQVLAGNKKNIIFETTSLKGKRLWLDTTSVPAKFDGKNVLLGITRDITERYTIYEEIKKTNEMLLQKSSELEAVNQAVGVLKDRYKTIMNYSADAIFIIDMNGGLVEYSRQTAELLGYTDEEMKNLTVYDWDVMVPREELPALLASVDENLISFETKHRRKDGSIYDAGVVAVLIDIKNTKYIYASARDITEQKSLEKLLSRQKEEFETIFGTSKDGVAILDLESKFLDFNDAYLEMTGFTKDELLTKTSIDITAPEDREYAKKIIVTVIRDGFLRNVEKAYIAKNGKRVMVNMTITLMPDKKRIIVSAKDVTEQNAINERVKLDALKLEIAAKSADIGIWTWNFASNTLTWNEQMYVIYGVENSGIVENQYTIWSEALHPDDKSRAESEVERAATFDGKFDTVFRIVTGADEIKYIKASGICQFDKYGEKVAMIGTNIDITEQRLYEDKLSSAIKAAEEANRSKSEFLANMSHEIRTPMNGIIGLTRLALDFEMSSAQRNYLEKINDSSYVLLNILNDILDYSKIEAGKLTLEDRDFLLDQVIMNSTGLFGQKAHEKGVEISTDIDPNIPNELQGDSFRLSQVLNNLIGNAIKFTENGSINISASKLETASHDEILFTVEDTGIGMHDEQLGKLFAAFEQADTSTTRKYGGTGLGLTISKQIVNLMGGAIWVKSEYGKGSKFFFTMPLKTCSNENVTSVKGVFDATSLHSESEIKQTMDKYSSEDTFSLVQGKKVLLVEDNSTNQLVAVGMMKKLGLEVFVSENGAEAVEAVRANDFDIVFMDLQMPIMGGLEAARKIREFKDINKLPIVAMTAAAMQEDKEDSLAAGMNYHLSKPIEFEELIEVVEQLIVGSNKPTTSKEQLESKIKKQVFNIEGFDNVRLNKFLDFGIGYDDVAKMIKNFRSNYLNINEVLSGLLANGNDDDTLAFLHTLKGSAGNIGVTKIYEMAQYLESEYKKTKTVEIDELLKEMHLIFEGIDAFEY